MRFHKISICIFSVLVSTASFSQFSGANTFNEYLRAFEPGNQFMGNVLITREDRTMYSRAIGYSNLALKTRADENTMYRIGSITKTITASLALKAVEDGIIRLDDPICEYFPTIAGARQITIRHLLNHHSGIHNFTGGNFMTWNMKPKNRRDLVDSIAKGGSDFTPGAKAAYSNSNFVLLSFILEDIYHKSYAEILDDQFIRPLHLTHFSFGNVTTDPSKRTLPYLFEAGWNTGPETDLSIPMGAGGIVSSAGDLAKALNAIFQGKIISKKMLAVMQEQVDGFGFGIFHKTIQGKDAFFHDGAIDGFNAYYYYFPADETLYLLLSNGENYNLETVNNTMVSILYNLPYEMPKFGRHPVDPGELMLYTGVYTSRNSPLIIDLTVKNNFLLAQPHGQKIYTMEPTAKDVFIHEKTGVTLSFDVTKKQMILKQGANTLEFTRQ